MTPEYLSDNPAATVYRRLEEFAKERKFIGKGPLAVALVVTRHAHILRLPLDPGRLLTERQGQVLGLGRAAVQIILKSHGIERVLAEEGGRTSRGSIEKMRDYVQFLNSLHADSLGFDLPTIEAFWIDRVRAFFAGKPLSLRLDSAWGVRAALRQLTAQVTARQKASPGMQILGTVMQHLVGAKLGIVSGLPTISHHCANANDQNKDRHGDFDVEDAAIHVTTSPTEALIRKCSEHLTQGKRPIIITTGKSMMTAEGLLENAGIAERVDVIEFEQFLATNIYEHSRFRITERRSTFERILAEYNVIIAVHESDPSLMIELGSGR